MTSFKQDKELTKVVDSFLGGCAKCDHIGFILDISSLIKFKCECQSEPKVVKKQFEWGEANE